nr:multidrug resistance protein 1-like [Quercus suber]POF16576.1 leptomycin b resistance protein pmd1 [Quercus suber]
MEQIPTTQTQGRQSRDSLRSIYSSSHDAHPSVDISGPAFDPGHPREWPAPAVDLSAKVYRQLLGFNPFKASYFTLYSSLIGFRDRAVAFGGALCAVAAGVPLPIISIVFGKLIDTFPPTEDEIRTRISELLGVAVAYFVVTALYTTAFGFSSEKISIRLRAQLLDTLLHLDQAYLDTHDIDVNALLSEKIDVIHAGCSEKVGIFIQGISYFVAAFIVGFILSPKLTGILLAAVLPTMIIVVTLSSRYVSRHAKRAGEHSEQANGIVESALKSVKVVQAFNMMGSLCKDHRFHLQEGIRSSIGKSVAAAVQVGAIFFVAYAINGLAFYIGSRMASEGQQGGSAGTIFAVVLLILDSSFVVAQFAPFMDIFARAASAREGMQTLFDARDEAVSQRDARRRGQDVSLIGAGIEFKDVSFAYPARPTVKAVSGLTLTVLCGSFTAIVGTSGGGKSTLFSLLTGVYGYSGSIKMGSSELREMNIGHVRQQTSVVEQEPTLFTGTIFENICNGLAGQQCDESEIAVRCKAAAQEAAVDFLDALPQGIHTRIGDGVSLSGGQKQRICLARALIRKPALLILDEPTSALDARSEVLIMNAVKRVAASGTTVIMVAHRLSTVLDADHVAVISDGRVVEHGTPQKLAVPGSIFQGLLDAQNTNLNHTPKSGKDDILQEKDSLSISGTSDVVVSDDVLGDVEKSFAKAQHSTVPQNTLLGIWRIIKPEVPLICGGLLASTISGGLLLGEAIIFGNLVQLLNQGVGEPGFQQHANFFCLMFFVLACIALAAWICSGTAFGIASARSVSRVQSRLLTQVLTLDIVWFSAPGHSVHSLMSAFTKDTGDLSCLSGPALGTIFTTTTSVVGGIILAHIVAWKIAVVLLSAVPVLVIAGFLRLRILGIADTRRRSAYLEATSLASEAFRNKRTVAVFALEEPILTKYRNALQVPYDNSHGFTVWSNVLLSISFAITYFVYALAYWWGSRQVRDGIYSEKQFFTVLPALLFSAQSAGQLFSLSPEIARAKAAARSIIKLLSYKPHILARNESKRLAVESTSTTLVKTPSPKSQSTTPAIAFEHVSLSYDPSNRRVALQDVTLSIHAGQTVAFVGPSGAGKSSTVALLERFYEPTMGVVRLHGSDLRDVCVESLRDSIGLVSQEPDLLPGSIMFNVRLGACKGQEVSDGDIERVCGLCGLHEFITGLPDGYNTNCGSNGSSKLSGGQRQRIALARALIRDPEILLLDEPTSALDAHSERQVQRALNEAAQGRTTIIVAHRLASIQHADRIFVFDQGCVTEQGSHAELIQLGGLYASMAKAQSLVESG